MDIREYLPIWDKLNEDQQNRIRRAITLHRVKKGTVIHNGNMDCTGLLLIQTGQLRAYLLSEEGREITLYRLFERDLCLLSASCMIRSIQFEVTVAAEKDTEFWLIPTEIYQSVQEESAPAAGYINELMASRFSEVMWLIEQVMWRAWINGWPPSFWKKPPLKARRRCTSPMRPSQTTWVRTGKSLPGYCVISRTKAWSSWPGEWWRSWTKQDSNGFNGDKRRLTRSQRDGITACRGYRLWAGRL